MPATKIAFDCRTMPPGWRYLLRTCGTLTLALIVAVQSACTTTPPTAGRDYAAGGGRLAIVAIDAAPDIDFKGFTRSKTQGALQTAGLAFSTCVTSLQGSCSGSACGAVIAVWLGICSIAGVVGGVVGAISVPGSASAQNTQEALRGSAGHIPAQEALRQQVVTAAILDGAVIADPAPATVREAVRARDYRALATQGVDDVLEVQLLKVGTDGLGIDDPLQSYMEARMRLVRTRDNREQLRSDLRFDGPRLRVHEWTANEGRPLLDMLHAGYEALAQRIYERAFLRYPFPDRQAHTSGFFAASFGLAPIEPSTRGQLTGAGLLAERVEWATVDSLQPTLAWESFPRASDVQMDADTMARVRNVRYDLIISREENFAPAEIVYRRDGLPVSRHTPSVNLRAGGRYFWSVRARFELDGRERVTEWSATRPPGPTENNAPSVLSYRFQVR